MPLNFQDRAYDDCGCPVCGATVNLYDVGTTTPSRANTTTNCAGLWSISHCTAGQFDVKITCGSTNRWIIGNAKRQFGEITLPDNANLVFGNAGDATIDYNATDLVIAPAVVGCGDLVVSGASVEFCDCEGVTFGTGKDTKISFDATNLIINPQVVGNGDVIISAGQLKLGGSAARACTEPDDNALSLFNVDASPVGTLTNGATFYVSVGEMFVMDASGNATQLSPHNPDTGEWWFNSRLANGRVVRIHAERILRALDAQLGGGFVDEFVEDPKVGTWDKRPARC